MPLKKITPLPGAALRIEMDNRGWKVRTLSERWGFKTRRRVELILKDDDRPRYLDDAIKGLPLFLGDPSLTVLPLAPSTSGAFAKSLMKKGWSSKLLSERWGLTKRRIDQIIANGNRPAYYDDAISGLPVIEVLNPVAGGGDL